MATALVTGGTSGVGAAFARSLARRGYDLVLVARDRDRLESVAADLRAVTGVSVEVLPADLGDRADVSRVVERITDDARPIDLLVNNAGFGVHTPLTSEDTTAHDAALEVMVRAVLVLGGAAGRTMRARGHGAIINVSSTAGFVTMGAYSAIKAWVTNYSEGLAVELRGTGVRVTALCPGWLRTEFHDRAGIATTSIPSSLWIDVNRTVETALRDSARGRVISIPTVRFGVLIWLARHAPRRTIRWVSGAISSSRHRDGEQAEASPAAVGSPE
jgi:short-subunit dehydrogenase